MFNKEILSYSKLTVITIYWSRNELWSRVTVLQIGENNLNPLIQRGQYDPFIPTTQLLYTFFPYLIVL